MRDFGILGCDSRTYSCSLGKHRFDVVLIVSLIVA